MANKERATTMTLDRKYSTTVRKAHDEVAWMKQMQLGSTVTHRMGHKATIQFRKSLMSMAMQKGFEELLADGISGDVPDAAYDLLNDVQSEHCTALMKMGDDKFGVGYRKDIVDFSWRETTFEDDSWSMEWHVKPTEEMYDVAEHIVSVEGISKGEIARLTDRKVEKMCVELVARLDDIEPFEVRNDSQADCTGKELHSALHSKTQWNDEGEFVVVVKQHGCRDV